MQRKSKIHQFKTFSSSSVSHTATLVCCDGDTEAKTSMTDWYRDQSQTFFGHPMRNVENSLSFFQGFSYNARCHCIVHQDHEQHFGEFAEPCLEAPCLDLEACMQETARYNSCIFSEREREAEKRRRRRRRRRTERCIDGS